MPHAMTAAPQLFQKLQAALRHHRQHVFDYVSGPAHERALRRLKRSHTFRTLAQENEDAASQRQGDRLTRMGY